MNRSSDKDAAQSHPMSGGGWAQLDLTGRSPKWTAALDITRRIAQNDATTLIEGETGTGKELIARTIHYLGARREAPFVPLNCGALSDSLLEAELFGYERGAFTDARERRRGLVAEAQGGTLFLDEVEAMSPRAQVVLLRFLQDLTYLAVGGRVLHTANVRIVAASNADLEEQVERTQFRSDLLFRLRVLYVRLPPLRERAGDISLLARHFLERFSETYSRPPNRLSPASLSALEARAWPGNVRELESLLLREFLMHDGNSDELVLSSACAPGASTRSVRDDATDFRSAKARAVANFERAYLVDLLRDARGNISLASRLAQKDRAALKRLAKKYGIRAAEFRAGVNTRSRTG